MPFYTQFGYIPVQAEPVSNAYFSLKKQTNNH